MNNAVVSASSSSLSSPAPVAEPTARRLSDAILAAASVHADRVALRMRQNGRLRAYTFAELRRRVETAATALSGAGLRAGDRVLLLCENCPEWALGYLAASHAGATLVPLDPGLSPADIAVLRQAAEPRLVISSRAQRHKLADDGHAPILLLEEELLADSPVVPPLPGVAATNVAGAKAVDADADAEIASIIFTSGTAGSPKGVMLTHASVLYAGGKCALPLWGMQPGDELLLVLPLHHIFGFAGCLIGGLLSGTSLTFVEALRGDIILAAINETRTTLLPAVPRLYELFADQIRRQVAARGPVARLAFTVLLAVSRGLRRFGLNAGPLLFKQVHARFGGRMHRLISGGAPLSHEVAELFEALGFSLLEGYGLTETSAAATGSTFAARRRGTAGMVVPGSELCLGHVSTAGEGEICVRGPSVMRGYFRNPTLTAQVLRDGWFHTGDLGRLDERGYVVVSGRLDELIVTPAGKKASPHDVEQHYQGLAGVKELAVIGMRAARGPGEHVHAAVVLDAEVDPTSPGAAREARERVEAAVAARAASVPSHLQIQRVHIVADIPKTTKLSVRRKELRTLLEAHLQKEAAAASAATPGRAESRPAAPTGSGGSAGAVDAQVVAVVQEIVGRESTVEPRSSLQFDLGLDSLARSELISSLLHRFGVDLSRDAVALHRVSDVIDAVRQRLGARGDGKGAAARSAAAAPEPAAGAAAPGSALATGAGAAAVPTQAPPPGSLVMRLLAFMAALGLRLVWRIDVRGLEKLPAGAFVLCANHATNLDAFWLASVIPQARRGLMCMFAKRELWQSRILRLLLKLVPAIPVDRDGDAQASLQVGVAALKAGRPLLVFPEGTRSRTGVIAPFRRGAASMALAAGVPVVPARLNGCYEIYPAHRKLPRFWPKWNLRRRRILIVIGDPVYASAAAAELSRAEEMLMERIRDSVLTDLAA